CSLAGGNHEEWKKMTIQEDVSVFFKDPTIPPTSPGEFSVLYLLRRDISQCITTKQILWPATMAILAGIDLLGKFYAGKDGQGVGQRFTNFVDKYFQPISPDDAQTIYQLRNALLHSFGLYSISGTKEYYFSLILPEAGPLVRQHLENPDMYLISIAGLYDKFETAIRDYKKDVENDPRLQNNFSLMYPYYGAVGIHPIAIR
ncbi:MAG: hypothetical protein KF770_27710, partial [Anaerolineae bacterium]|nr:hypothetical protein [Anaerolineae bacterium]